MAKDTTSAAWRHRGALKTLTLANAKTPKGEEGGYLTAVLYLAPHTLADGKTTVCPYSTPACRDMCLAGAGMAGLPKQMAAKINRTMRWLIEPDRFLEQVADDIQKLIGLARREGMTPIVRLNGTSDVCWEKYGLIQTFADVQFYDYTKLPLHHRRPLRNYHLTFSADRNNLALAEGYLTAGCSVAAVVPEEIKAEIMAGAHPWHVIDGDEHDLRFLDPWGCLVLLKPKGTVLTSLVIPDIDYRLAEIARDTVEMRERAAEKAARKLAKVEDSRA